MLLLPSFGWNFCSISAPDMSTSFSILRQSLGRLEWVLIYLFHGRDYLHLHQSVILQATPAECELLKKLLYMKFLLANAIT